MKHKILSLLTFLLIGSVGFAQTKTVTGLVKDAVDGSGLPGATIAIKGTTQGTTTDVDGAFSIRASVGDTLSITYIGKIAVTQVVDQRNVIEIILYDDTETLEEVTVVAFGTQKKQSVVASIETVRVSDLKIPSSNLTTAMAGRIPGLISYQTSGEPGRDNAQFFIRGVTTFGYKTDPLILIDGFEMGTDDLARLQVDDIESFSVLKDASATVLYGSRAANGIILITTKKGIEGPVKLSVRVDNHIATPTRIPQLVDGITYMRMYNEAQMTRNPLLGAYYSEQKIQSTATGENPMIYPNVNWYDEIFKSSTMNTKANINVSGGGQVATYYVAGGFEHETGLLKVDPRNNYNSNISINRFNIRTNVNFKLTSTTILETQVHGRFERQTGPWENPEDSNRSSATVGIFSDIMNSNPVDFPAVYEPDEANRFTTHTLFGNTYVLGSRKNNPYAEMTRGYTDRNESNITAQATLRQDLKFITEGLNVQLKGSINNWSRYTSTRTYTPFYYDLESYNRITGEHTLWCLNPNTGQAHLGDVVPGRNATFKYYFEARATWMRQFDLHNVGAMLVSTMEENLLTSGSSTSIYETLPEKNTGLSGRFTYDFDTRYFLEFSFGYNGSEKFDGSKRFGFYPSIAGGWLISNEKFWQPMRDMISTLKLKGSIGRIGNDAIAERKDRFFYLSDISVYNPDQAIDNGYRWGESFMNSYGGYKINRYANPNITWELSTKWNVGVEANFMKERLKIQAEMFGEDRDNIYMVRENFPATAGLESSISGNVGRLKAKGFDGSIDYQHFFTSDFWMTGRANFTYSDNKYIQLDEKDYPDEYLKRLGHNVKQEWGLIAERLFVDQEEIENSPPQDYGEYMAGDIKYKDVNGDGVINNNDRVPLGYPTVPKIQYGFGLSTGYKDFDFSFFFQGNSMVSFFINPGVSGTEGIAPFVARRNALKIVADDYWSETNPNVYAFWPRLSTLPISNNTTQSSWWLRDASFMRLKQVELGYTLKGWQKIGMRDCRIYLTLENLFVLSKFKLWDPEMGKGGLGYPPNRRYNIGLHVNF
ncbi:MAG: TonB-dependent receptor [Tannerella sp.]|nr:TonB-dependent receptor [Tannerella sp.]